MTDAPSPFSTANPKLQTAWDATSLRALMVCPRYYQYSILEGWRGSSIDLEFGILYAGARETFAKALLAGKTRDEAQIEAVKFAVEKSGTVHPGDGARDGLPWWEPWGGSYVSQWRCLGTEPYKNAKGNRAKCPWSHAGHWHDLPAPEKCGECGSSTETIRRWLPTDPAKDRYGLVRAVSWSCEEEPEVLGQGVSPYAFPDGKPAVELPFRIPLPYKTPSGEAYLLCGYFDGIKSFGDEMFIADDKTSKKTLGKAYFAGFSPHIQVDVYDLVGSILFPELNLRGVLIEGAQTLVSGARFAKQVAYRSEALREETLADLRYLLDDAEKYAANDHWPKHTANCWLCAFKGVCSKDPDQRQKFLEADFTVRKWNPLDER